MVNCIPSWECSNVFLYFIIIFQSFIYRCIFRRTIFLQKQIFFMSLRLTCTNSYVQVFSCDIVYLLYLVSILHDMVNSISDDKPYSLSIDHWDSWFSFQSIWMISASWASFNYFPFQRRKWVTEKFFTIGAMLTRC